MIATRESHKVLVTGASGFVGSALCGHLIKCGYNVIGTVRKLPVLPIIGVDYQIVGDLGTSTSWNDSIFSEVGIIIHCAARVHVMNEYAQNPLNEFRQINTQGTDTLARSAAKAGIRRFIFLSSIKVNGESSSLSSLIDETSPTNPKDYYGISKLEAEKSLINIADETGMETVIFRLPLVYGPGVRGNFIKLLKMVDRGVPLPFSLVNNLRSLINIDNLTDVIEVCLKDPRAVGKIYTVSDSEDVSTVQLIIKMAHALERPVRLWPCPLCLIELAGMLAGRSDEVSRILGSLRIDSKKIYSELGWAPTYTLTQGLSQISAWYHRRN